MRGGGLGLPPPPPQPKSLGDGSFQLPTVPAKTDTGTIAPICPDKSHLEGSSCVVDGAKCPEGTLQKGDKCSPPTQEDCPPTTPILFQGKCVDQLPVISGSTTGTGGGFIQMFPTVPANKDGSCPEGSHSAGSSGNAGQSGTGSITCISDSPKANALPANTPTTQTGGTGGTKTGTTTTTGGTTTGTTPTQTGGTTTGAGGTTTGGGTTPEPPAELEVPPLGTTNGGCPEGTHSVGSSGSAGQPGTGSIHCLAQKTPDGSFILPSFPQIGSACIKGYVSVGGNTCVLDISCPQATTKIGATQCIVNKLLPASTTTASLPAKTGTTGTGTTTTTGNPSTPATTTTTTAKPPTTATTTTTTTTNVINRGSSSGGGGGSTTTTASPAPGQLANNAFLTYVNAVNKITMKYPSSWTKRDLVGNPRIPVVFSAPTATTATPDTKTSFVISITPSASNLDSFTQQQINALTQSKAIKYTVTSTDAKVLTPPAGITAFHEVGYDALKNNNIPLKGAGIFFVSGGTGYSLLYLAKQTDYTQNLPMVQQMVNSFQVGNGAGSTSNGVGPVQNVAAASSSAR